jgi:hypothetical protein
MGMQSAATLTLGLITDDATSNIYSPKSGSQSISNLGLDRPCHPYFASHLAMTVMRLQNVVEQARANMGAGSGMW